MMVELLQSREELTRVMIGKIDKVYTYSIYPDVMPFHLVIANQCRRIPEGKECAAARAYLSYLYHLHQCLESADGRCKSLCRSW
jgi:hypothetical protein